MPAAFPELPLTWLDTEALATGEALLRRPEWSGSWSFTTPWKLLVLSGPGIYAGRRWDVDPVTFARTENGAFYRQDLSLALDKPEWLSPWVKGENLFNSSYEEVLGYPAMGRRLSAGVTGRW